MWQVRWQDTFIREGAPNPTHIFRQIFLLRVQRWSWVRGSALPPRKDVLDLVRMRRKVRERDWRQNVFRRVRIVEFGRIYRHVLGSVHVETAHLAWVIAVTFRGSERPAR